MKFKTGFVILVDAQTNWLGQPSRIFEPLAGRTAFDFLIGQISEFDLPIILSIKSADEKIISRVKSYENIDFIECTNLMESQRLLEVCNQYELETMIRLSADNPILGKELINQGIDLMNSCDFVYSYGYPVGINLEFINRETLLRCVETGSAKRIREIITTDLSKEVKISYIQADGILNRPEVRWTTGSESDHTLVNNLLTDVATEPQNMPSLKNLMLGYNQLMQHHIPSPTMVNIEPTNKCNLKCIMCPRDKMERSLGVMDLETFKRVIDQCVETGVTHITLNGYGEPFIAKQIFEMITYTMQSSLNLKINTNGHYLNPKNIDKLLDNPPSHLSISLDGATKETYEKISNEFAKSDPKKRVKWAGPDMSVRSSITARHMETWAHGQEIFDQLGFERIDTDRIKNIVVIGVNTFGWTYINRNLSIPEKMPKLSLLSPSNELWEWNEDNEEDMISGSATEFSQVVTQVRNFNDTSLKVSGKIANEWMSIAQCFAGPPENPPEKGTRFTRKN